MCLYRMTVISRTGGGGGGGGGGERLESIIADYAHMNVLTH